MLKEFYAKAVEATALAQSNQEPPPVFDSPINGRQGEGDGVICMLKAIELDV